MSAAHPLDEIPDPASAPRFLVELPSWSHVFYDNLCDLIFPRSLPPLELRSTSAPFWPDVIVERELPWRSFLQSAACHVIAFVLLLGFTRFFALPPRAVARPTFDRAQVVYYQPSEYLPPLDTRSRPKAQAQPTKADPEFSRQPIISVPHEADNSFQTIVTPPQIKLKRGLALPNVVAWSESMSDQMQKPRLAIPPVPLTPAADITRIAPQLQNSVVAPPPALRSSNAATFQAPQLAVIAPPPSVEIASTRPLGELNIDQSSVIAPAPQLPVADQRTIHGSRSAGLTSPQLVPPPPALSPSGYSADSFEARGRVIALNLHPTIGAPPYPPPGNRRGAFAAAPEGHPGASGAPGVHSENATARTGASKEIGNGSTRKGISDIPSGLYVGGAAAKSSSVSGNKSSTNSVNPNLIASVRPPRVISAPSRTMQSESAIKLSEAERAIFGSRKFYSLTVNMPNLNSTGGSWVIRFAELDRSKDSSNRDSNNHAANSSAGDLSQPAATRKVDPAYPLQLMRENVAGTVILYAMIHADGTVGNVRVLRGVDGRLDHFATQAVAQWQFQPAMKNGAPVDVEATFQIPFRPAPTNF